MKIELKVEIETEGWALGTHSGERLSQLIGNLEEAIEMSVKEHDGFKLLRVY